MSSEERVLTGQLTFEVLLVEDNFADVHLARRLLKELTTKIILTVANDGEQALAILRREDYHPALVILDLKLPRKNGFEVLSDMKSDDRLATIPVIVLSASSEPSDVAQCYKLHANAYVLKPLMISDVTRVWTVIESFWMSLALLPPRCNIPATQTKQIQPENSEIVGFQSLRFGNSE